MAYDRTEGKLKIIGFVGTGIAALSSIAVATWKTLKEVDKIHEAKELEKPIDVEPTEVTEEKAD